MELLWKRKDDSVVCKYISFSLLRCHGSTCTTIFRFLLMVHCCQHRQRPDLDHQTQSAQNCAHQYSPKTHQKNVNGFTDKRTGIPSMYFAYGAHSTAHGGAQSKGIRSKDGSNAPQQQQRSGKSLFDPQPKQQKDATRVSVGGKEQSRAKSSAAANEFAGLMKEMQSLSTARSCWES